VTNLEGLYIWSFRPKKEPALASRRRRHRHAWQERVVLEVRVVPRRRIQFFSLDTIFYIYLYSSRGL
jgi:hypothetical protein